MSSSSQRYHRNIKKLVGKTGEDKPIEFWYDVLYDTE